MTNELKQLPTGIQTFQTIREENYLYVDKTALIYRLAKEHRYVFKSGYLTIKDYDSDMDSYTLKYPNKEVRSGMINALIPYYVDGNTINAKSVVADVYKAIRRDNLDEAPQTLRVYLASIPYAENATSEGHYQTMLYVVFSPCSVGFAIRPQGV